MPKTLIGVRQQGKGDEACYILELELFLWNEINVAGNNSSLKSAFRGANSH